jgi:predicted amidohydrolase YtcJ
LTYSYARRGDGWTLASVLAVGSLRTVTELAGEVAAGGGGGGGGYAPPVLNLGGAWVVPGLFDTHLHLISGGFRLAQLDLSAVTSKSEFIARVTAAAAKLDSAAGEWLLGGGGAVQVESS